MYIYLNQEKQLFDFLLNIFSQQKRHICLQISFKKRLKSLFLMFIILTWAMFGLLAFQLRIMECIIILELVNSENKDNDIISDFKTLKIKKKILSVQ